MTSIPPGSGPIPPSCPQAAGHPPTFFMDAIAQRNRDQVVGYSSLDPRTLGIDDSGLADVLREAQLGTRAGRDLARDPLTSPAARAAYQQETEQYVADQVAAGPPLSRAEQRELVTIVRTYSDSPRLERTAIRDFFEQRGVAGRAAGIELGR